MTFEQAFLKVKEKFDNADATGIADFAIEIHFTDEDCNGTFRAVVADGKLEVEAFEYNDNDAHLDISKSALLAYLGGRTSLAKAIEDGQAYLISGDISKVEDWKSTIKKAKKPAAAKKEAVKTEATAKPVPAKKEEVKKAAPAKKEEVKKAAPVKKEETVKPAAKKAASKAPAKKTAKKN